MTRYWPGSKKEWQRGIPGRAGCVGRRAQGLRLRGKEKGKGE